MTVIDLVEFALMVGNDYSRNLPCWEDMKAKYVPPDEFPIDRVISAINTNNAFYFSFKRLLNDDQGMMQAYLIK